MLDICLSKKENSGNKEQDIWKIIRSDAYPDKEKYKKREEARKVKPNNFKRNRYIVRTKRT